MLCDRHPLSHQSNDLRRFWNFRPQPDPLSRAFRPIATDRRFDLRFLDEKRLQIQDLFPQPQTLTARPPQNTPGISRSEPNLTLRRPDGDYMTEEKEPNVNPRKSS